uniref:Uncharacterized protein n=1 Tax=Romanomermis culicivorax TaxID=13658 RepID=A0A915KA38_ROMCU
MFNPRGGTPWKFIWSKRTPLPMRMNSGLKPAPDPAGVIQSQNFPESITFRFCVLKALNIHRVEKHIRYREMFKNDMCHECHNNRYEGLKPYSEPNSTLWIPSFGS